jgi:hypothetical protein
MTEMFKELRPYVHGQKSHSIALNSLCLHIEAGRLPADAEADSSRCANCTSDTNSRNSVQSLTTNAPREPM